MEHNKAKNLNLWEANQKQLYLYFTGVARNGTWDNREWIQIQLAIRAELLKAWLALTIG